MKIKLILILTLGLITLLFPVISAEEFSIELEPHYYVQGKEVIWTPDVEISAVTFEVVGINHNFKYRIVNLSIIDAYPLALKNALPDTVESLRISQEKTLWTSKIIDLDDVNDLNTDFWIGVEGTLENTQAFIYQEEHLNVTLIMPEDEDDSFLRSLGERIWEGSPTNGIMVLVIAIIIGGFIWWHYKGSDKLDQWRDKSEKRRVEKRRYEERWY